MRGIAKTVFARILLVFALISLASVSRADYCPSQENGTTGDGDAVVVCKSLYTTAPAVRVPDAVVDGTRVDLFAAVSQSGTMGASLYDSDGAEYTILGPDSKPFRFKDSAGKLPAALKMPSNRTNFLIYRVRGTLGPVLTNDYGNTTKSISVAEMTPAVLIRGRALDSAFLGRWVGTVTKRNPDPAATPQTRFLADQLVPIDLQFTGLTRRPDNLCSFDKSSTLADGDVYALDGVVSNFSDLAALGAQNPFLGATDGRVTMYRFDTMHFAGDNVIVFAYPQGTQKLTANGMTGNFMMQPAALIRKSPAPDRQALTIFPHGISNMALKIGPSR
ncbi:MAG: hypothetical protein ACHQ49_15180 [Elusimicrobiota bacterium]